MKIERAGIVGVALAALALQMACAKAPIPYKAPVTATPPSGRVDVAHAVNVLDASGSQEVVFAEGRAALESLVGVMPSGRYQAGNVIFGGSKRESTGVSAFDRAVLTASAKNAPFLEGTTPIFRVIEQDLRQDLAGTSGRAAIVLISDGIATDFAGRPGSDERTVEAARRLVASRSGDTCFHTLQLGSDPAGAALLDSLAGVSACGSARSASSLVTASDWQQFSRQAYLGDGAPSRRETPVAAATRVDTDGDGVTDDRDACPGTLRGAPVDARGCWTLEGIRFGVNSAEIAGDWSGQLKEDLAVLRANPTVRVRIDGHTDSDGSAAYNQGLSERRAAAVRDYFVEEGGLDADRFEIKGFGESQPAAPNDSAANKRRNRRVELTIID